MRDYKKLRNQYTQYAFWNAIWFYSPQITLFYYDSFALGNTIHVGIAFFPILGFFFLSMACGNYFALNHHLD